MKVLVFANYDVGLYRFRRELSERPVFDGNEVVIALTYRKFIPNAVS